MNSYRAICVDMYQRSTLVVGELGESNAKLGWCHSQATLAPTVLQVDKNITTQIRHVLYAIS